MKKQELEFRKIMEVLDKDFSEFLLDINYEMLEKDGLTQINPLDFRKRYWSKPVDSVTINPNANLGNTGEHKSFCNLVSELSSPINKLSATSLIRKYGNRVKEGQGDSLVKSIINGKLYHHNLTLYDIPYCVGLSVYPILTDGLDFFNSLKSNPPKRPTSFVNQTLRYIQYASNMFAGATAITDFFVNYSYFTKNKQGYTDKERENDLQNLVHGLTDEIRLSGQSPFTNLSLLGPEIMRTMYKNYCWGDSKIEELIPEVMHNQILYTRFFSKGILGKDRKPIGLPYRFPVTTLVADKSFEKEYPSEWREIIEGNSNLCYLNILNQYNTGDLKSLSMCCRLTQNIEDLLKLQVNNTFGSFLQVGSHAVVTINLPRIALETKNEEKFIEILKDRLEECRSLLLIHRNEILTKRRLKYHYFFRTGKLSLKRNFFSTIGFIGLPDALEYLNIKINEPSGLTFAKKILETMKETSVRFSKEDEVMYNIEEVPAESAAGLLADKDRILGGTKDFYNSQFVPLSYDIPLTKRIEIEGTLQKLCTGGSISHLNVNGVIEPETSYNFIMNCLQQTDLTQFALNKGFTICANGHNSQGIFKECPSCGTTDLEHITRIVGYFVPVKNWNKSKQLEYSTRKWSNI